LKSFALPARDRTGGIWQKLAALMTNNRLVEETILIVH
jgi:hypothetical protein